MKKAFLLLTFGFAGSPQLPTMSASSSQGPRRSQESSMGQLLGRALGLLLLLGLLAAPAEAGITFTAAGTVATGIQVASITPPLPAGFVANDIFIAVASRE